MDAAASAGTVWGRSNGAIAAQGRRVGSVAVALLIDCTVCELIAAAQKTDAEGAFDADAHDIHGFEFELQYEYNSTVIL